MRTLKDVKKALGLTHWDKDAKGYWADFLTETGDIYTLVFVNYGGGIMRLHFVNNGRSYFGINDDLTIGDRNFLSQKDLSNKNDLITIKAFISGKKWKNISLEERNKIIENAQ